MRDLRIQYALTFGMIGTVLPYVSVFFRHAGLSAAQVGYAWAIWSGALVFSPALITMLADARIDPRRLLALASVVSGLCLLALGFADGVASVLGIWAVYCLASMPILPLQDGVHFSQQRRRRERGEPQTPYPRVRVWGTIGYIIPSLLIFGFMQAGMSLRGVLMTGTAFAALAAVQALRLQDPRAGEKRGTSGEPGEGLDRRPPTLAAARVLLRPNLLVFVIAIIVVQAMAAVHGAFYPIHLTERVGIGEQWLGQISNIAVFIEIFFVYGCGSLMTRFGLKNLLLVAIAMAVVRFGLLAASAEAWVALATQVFHGIMLIATGVIPPMVLDEAAEDRFRHSMQGVFIMVAGAGRAVGNALAGVVAAWSLAGLYYALALACAAAGLLLLFGFRDPRRADKRADDGDAAPDSAAACPAPSALTPDAA